MAYKTFCDMLSKEEADKCCLMMHTAPVDDNGTDLPAVAAEICPEYNIKFVADKVDDRQMNWLYNIDIVPSGNTISTCFHKSFRNSRKTCIVYRTEYCGTRDI